MMTPCAIAMKQAIDKVRDGYCSKENVRVALCNAISDNDVCSYPDCNCHGPFKDRLDRLVPCVIQIAQAVRESA